MLMVTPATLARLRAETRAPVSLAPIKAAPFKKLGRARREAIIEKLAGMMRRAEPTPFAIEGPARAGVRSALCMSGWPWGAADVAAADVVETALARVGAERPSWKAGQPEHTQQAVLPIEREFCVRCGKRLHDGALKYCGDVCKKAAAVDQLARRYDEEKRARVKAYRATWVARQPARECPSCGRYFQPKMLDAKYCSTRCYQDARRLERRNMRMVCEAVRSEISGSEIL
ncbi:MAG TPA: hypothetical protein VIF40_20435 [Methylosinus sp.]|jgi:hypothetical protein|uniref:hypothetical protein n=1 Tax=Methylosinus sp. TaxID=427 RepID=UPI002F94C0E2